MFDMGVGRMALLDASADMLCVAREKFAVEIKANKVSAIAQTSLPKIPFDDGTFDAVLLNTVLHHLPSGSGRNFFHAVETLKEARRVLQPDGVIAITLLLDTSSTNAWFLNLSPEILDKICSVSPSAEEWNKMVFAAGLKCLLKTNLHGFGLLGDEDYIEYNNIFKQEWRNSIVMFEHTTKEEIEHVSQKVKSLHMKGEIKGWIKDHDKTQQFGFISLFLCQ
ncbi:uncharacterized protein LOC128239372 [Mya arenaria]|uniref:uncharacterized protein LOC128239372 n=1 Tax=Mya arenaria TaxID=6604 RepID=UPI0022DFCDFD|nr:uncharacterized protein LOC128239372 [Mya arenaria]